MRALIPASWRLAVAAHATTSGGSVPQLEPDLWCFDLPITKPLSMNDRTHWRKKYEARDELNSAVIMLVRKERIPPCQRIRVTLVYTPKDKRRRDPLNLVETLKPVEDAIVRAGVVPDDTPQYLESQMPLIDLPDPGQRFGKLTVYVQRVA